ncbi:MAG: alkaline phosphatase [Magnetococcales bacterium]|nr:alkaline phosphatase [Magnetococcales bacterium]
MISSGSISMDRREFLRGLVALAALVSVPDHVRAGEALSWEPDFFPFVLGVASGSPSADGFVLWTRLMGERVPVGQDILVHWEVFDLQDPTQILAKGDAVARAVLGHAVHVEVAGLAANRWYGYRFRVGTQVSMPGRTRTLPPMDGPMPERLRFAYVSCQHWEQGYYAGYRHMLEEKLDVVLFLGDYIYEYASSADPNVVRRHHLPVARTLEDYRARYAVYKSDPWLQAMHAHCPWLVIWDDHEVENDYRGVLSIYNTDNFLSMRAAAYQAYYEHMPLRAATLVAGLEGMLRGAEMRIYQRVAFGSLAMWHLLDCRQYRDDPAEEKRSMLGHPQEEWLDEGVRLCAEQKIPWNLVVHQNRFTPANYPDGAGKKASSDRWDGYPEARVRLLQALATHKPRNTVLIGGDIHQNWVAHVHLDPYDVRSSVVASEFVGTSISSRMGRPQHVAEKHAAQNPHCVLVNTERRGYGVVELSATQAVVELRVLEDVRDEESGISTLARFVVEEGKPLRRDQGGGWLIKN